MYKQDFEYAGTRLAGTIVRILKSDEPVYVEFVTRDGLCQVCKITEMEKMDHKSMAIHLDDLNTEPVKLGYVNHAGKAVYVMRIPVRRGPNNQGLRRENSTCSGGRSIDQIPKDALRNCIIGRYPTYIKARDSVLTNNDGKAVVLNKSIAFDRHWSIHKDYLVYKDNIVGKCYHNKKRPVLDPGFKYLQEALDEIK